MIFRKKPRNPEKYNETASPHLFVVPSWHLSGLTDTKKIGIFHTAEFGCFCEGK
jgi:hypothetical protein